MTKPGHNSQGGIAGAQLRSFIERIERLMEEKAALAEDIKEVYAEAKGSGFDPKTMRQVIRLRKMEEHARKEQEALLDLYMDALGMLVDTPLGAASLRRAAENLGTPVDLTEEEKAKGYTAAFVDKKGQRVSMGVGVKD